MKKVIIAVLCVSSCLCTIAQPITNAPTVPAPGSLPQTILNYFTSFDTNATTFTSNRVDLWTGADSVQGAVSPLVQELGLSYDLVTVSSKARLGIEAIERNTGLAGNLDSVQGGLDLSIIVWDTKLTLYGNGGYYFDPGEVQRIYGEVGFRAKKAVGQHFYMGVGTGIQIPRQRQVYEGFVGVTF